MGQGRVSCENLGPGPEVLMKSLDAEAEHTSPPWLKNTHLCHILHVHHLLGLSHMAHNPNVQWEYDLRVRGHQAVLQEAIWLHAEEPCGKFGYAIALAVHKEAAAVSMQDGAEASQDLEDDTLHIDILLHVLHQFKQCCTLFHLAQLPQAAAVHQQTIFTGRCHIFRAQLLPKVLVGKSGVPI